MYAIIATDGRQYKVKSGDEIQIDLREGVNEGDTVTFDRVLLLEGGDIVKVGTPVVEGATVTGEVLSHDLGEKLYIQKMRRRKNYRRRTGHRQQYTRVRIGTIGA